MWSFEGGRNHTDKWDTDKWVPSMRVLTSGLALLALEAVVRQTNAEAFLTNRHHL